MQRERAYRCFYMYKLIGRSPCRGLKLTFTSIRSSYNSSVLWVKLPPCNKSRKRNHISKTPAPTTLVFRVTRLVALGPTRCSIAMLPAWVTWVKIASPKFQSPITLQHLCKLVDNELKPCKATIAQAPQTEKPTELTCQLWAAGLAIAKWPEALSD